MKKIVRNVFALLLALTFILSLAACGGNSASSGAAPAASGSEETSTVASTPGNERPCYPYCVYLVGRHQI